MLCQIEPDNSKSANISAVRTFFMFLMIFFSKLTVFVVFRIFDWSSLINLTDANGQLDHHKSESAKKLKSEHLFYFFLIFEVFKGEKTELPTLKNKTNLKIQITNNQKILYCSE